MLFNSLNFAIFLPLVFFIHWFFARKNVKIQNLIILIFSYIFYGFWSWKFVLLLLLSTVLDFVYGHFVASENRKKAKFFLWLSIINNLGILAVFKYYDFFAVQFKTAMNSLGFHVEPYLLNLVLPVGISFYTFHGMSYVFDIYKGRQKPERDFLTYGVFVSFFPLLVAGPIERASHLLPQLKKLRRFNYNFALEGVYQILWGLFKKMVIADNAAILVNQIFQNDHLQGSTLILGTFLFAFQAYGDFSGYSDIAIGTAKLFGVQLITNFKYPYFSRDFAEFWRRWHISLFSFFRDYVYIPLGGSKGNTLMKIRNTLIVFLISGFWHGAKWTFMFWGLLNALSVIPSQLFRITKKVKKTPVVAQFTKLPSLKELLSMLLTFGIYNLILIFFRAESISAGFNYLSRLLKPMQILKLPKLSGIQNTQMVISFIFILVLLVVEWNYRREEYALRKFQFQKLMYQVLIFSILGLIIVVFHGQQQNFIYFQF